MAKNVYTNVNVNTVNAIDLRQTVLIETNYGPKKADGSIGDITSKRVFIGGYPKRAAAYYDCFVADGYKHKRGVAEYRLLKLHRTLEEVKDATYPVSYHLTDSYVESLSNGGFDISNPPAPVEQASEAQPQDTAEPAATAPAAAEVERPQEGEPQEGKQPKEGKAKEGKKKAKGGKK